MPGPDGGRIDDIDSPHHGSCANVWDDAANTILSPERFVKPMKPIALISMPTLSAYFPSFQLALLKPTLEREGIPVQPFSLFVYFGASIGWQLNEAMAEVRDNMVGEWIWAKAAF